MDYLGGGGGGKEYVGAPLELLGGGAARPSFYAYVLCVMQVCIDSDVIMFVCTSF